MPMKGDLPLSTLVNHEVCYSNGYIYLFGGRSHYPKILNIDLYSYKDQWRKVKTLSSLKFRRHFSMQVFGCHVLLIGGLL